MSRQAKAMQPRWRGKQPVPQTVIQVRGRGARRLTRQIAATTTAPAAATALPVYRNRHRLVPVTWGFVVTGTGAGLWLTHRPAVLGLLAGVVAGALIVLATRHLDAWAKAATLAAAGLTAFWLPLLAAFGKPVLPFWAACWAVLTWKWTAHYRIRPQDEPPGPTRDQEIWARLADKRKWAGDLGQPEKIPGGLRYPIKLDGVETHIGQVTSQPLAIAAAWDKSITEAYVEPAPTGIASEGFLTLLRKGNLQDVREWSGTSVTADGFAVIGRFADGAPVRIRLFAPMDGPRHGLISGTSGAGKSSLLDLMLHIMLSSGFMHPVILDPQEGQSLPDWDGRVPYAAGALECMEMLTRLWEGMFARSRALRAMTWDDDGHTRRMSFFDHRLTGWPLVPIIADEMHILLTGQEPKLCADAIALAKDIGKLGRKTGVSLWLVTQVPSLEELGSQTLRAMLAGGTVISLRTAEKVSQGMLGLPADPFQLPKVFPNGEFTYGLGYVIGADNRQAIARTDVPSAAHRRAEYLLPPLDDPLRAALSRIRLPEPEPVLAVTRPLTAVEDTAAAPGQSAADAVLTVLTRPMERGEILEHVRELAVQQWGREQPFSLKAVSDALKRLKEEGKVSQPADRKPYSPARPSLSLVGGNPAASTGER